MINCLFITMESYFHPRILPAPNPHLTLSSHEWPRQNFSLQYQYTIEQTIDEKKEKYQLGN